MVAHAKKKSRAIDRVLEASAQIAMLLQEVIHAGEHGSPHDHGIYRKAKTTSRLLRADGSENNDMVELVGLQVPIGLVLDLRNSALDLAEAIDKETRKNGQENTKEDDPGSSAGSPDEDR